MRYPATTKKHGASMRRPSGERIMHRFGHHVRPRAFAARSARGFTIQEMLVALCISGSLAGGGVGMWGVVQESRVTAAANDLVSQLAVARMQAVKRHAKAIVCPSADQRHCAAANGDYTHWQHGWLVYVDADGDGEPGPDEIVQVQPALAPSVLIRTSHARTQ